ncbi:alpha/beta-Hydrolases superfamily protein [Striga asiatica]|uniref:Alpha/beta-Hydrolases superfamily protein n=1 Tax=Striga asiatica TaxID=4170 RepID=A0A5A7PKJ5_STRAF|nr:alpha/beta-Hydrolases superfamily protein [Striga asiatica]
MTHPCDHLNEILSAAAADILFQPPVSTLNAVVFHTDDVIKVANKYGSKLHDPSFAPPTSSKIDLIHSKSRYPTPFTILATLLILLTSLLSGISSGRFPATPARSEYIRGAPSLSTPPEASASRAPKATPWPAWIQNLTIVSMSTICFIFTSVSTRSPACMLAATASRFSRFARKVVSMQLRSAAVCSFSILSSLSTP